MNQVRVTSLAIFAAKRKGSPTPTAIVFDRRDAGKAMMNETNTTIAVSALHSRTISHTAFGRVIWVPLREQGMPVRLDATPLFSLIVLFQTQLGACRT